MSETSTAVALENFSDVGQFEKLASSVLRRTRTDCRSLSHTGVNAEGKAIKDPVDGLVFLQDESPFRAVFVHHTTTLLDGLESKWLHDSSKVIPRGKSRKPTQPDGDVIKTAKVVEKLKTTYPDLKATLILTTNREPNSTLQTNTVAEGRRLGLNIEFVTRSSLEDYLDNEPQGQWLRSTYLGIEHELLSTELLDQLILQNLEEHRPSSDAETWVPSDLDNELSSIRSGGTWLLVAESGMGKSVAGFKMLQSHLKKEKKGLILSHETLGKASSLKHAVVLTLKRLCPNLADLSFATDPVLGGLDQFLFIVEDINRSGSPLSLCEKILGWRNSASKDKESTSPPWTIIASIWPDIYSILGKTLQEKANQQLIITKGFSLENAKAAISQRAALEGIPLSDTQAHTLAEELGYDPLLISLYSWDNKGLVEDVVETFIAEVALSIAHSNPESTSHEILEALNSLGESILVNRLSDVTWRDVKQAEQIDSNHLRELSKIAGDGRLMRLVGNPAKPRLEFRHDRVRSAILANAVVERLPSRLDVVTDPFYAEIVGEALCRNDCPKPLLDLAVARNPLSILCAFRRSSPIEQDRFAQLLLRWTEQSGEHSSISKGLLWEASRLLAQTTHPMVSKIVTSYEADPYQRDIALFLNGNVRGGISLLEWCSPDISSKWRDAVVEHALLHHRDQLLTELSQILEDEELILGREVGALNLAGYLNDSSLNPLIKKRWGADHQKLKHLASYLWAATHCYAECANSPLEDLVDFWFQAIYNEKDKNHLEQKVDYSSLKCAFRKHPPRKAITKLIKYGKDNDAEWPIYVTLSEVDDPNAFKFIVNYTANKRKKAEESGGFYYCLSTVTRTWDTEHNTHGRAMSSAGLELLRNLWRSSNSRFVQQQAFDIWEAASYPKGLEDLTQIDTSLIPDKILRARVRRGDYSVREEYLEELRQDDSDYWWHVASKVWNKNFGEACSIIIKSKLDARESNEPSRMDFFGPLSSELLKIPADDAEAFIKGIWTETESFTQIFQAALCIGTPHLSQLVKKRYTESKDREDLFKHIFLRFGFSIKGGPGFNSEERIINLLEFSDHLREIDISHLWSKCNEHGWYDLRKEHLDHRIDLNHVRGLIDRSDVFAELDKLLEERQHLWIGHWVDEVVKSNYPWDDLIEKLGAWLVNSTSPVELFVATEILKNNGSRADLSILNIELSGASPENIAIVEDCKFVVCRRNLN